MTHMKLDEMKEMAKQDANKKEWRLISRVLDRSTGLLLGLFSVVNTIYVIFRYHHY